MNITADQIKKLREVCGAGVMECRKALEEAEGNMDKAMEIIHARGLKLAEEKKERVTKQGMIECYSHGGGRVVSVVELLCETDFVARNEDFRTFAHEIAMQVAAMKPKSVEELLEQEYIRDPGKKIADLLNGLVSKIRENIKIGRIARFELGE
ncbi:MAG: translation elongation factor Ts [Patescibacteria group bacterium]|nr:translation elongation factor Ts [Patescibacteria group bacterium]